MPIHLMIGLAGDAPFLRIFDVNTYCSAYSTSADAPCHLADVKFNGRDVMFRKLCVHGPKEDTQVPTWIE